MTRLRLVVIGVLSAGAVLVGATGNPASAGSTCAPFQPTNAAVQSTAHSSATAVRQAVPGNVANNAGGGVSSAATGAVHTAVSTVCGVLP